MKNTVKEGALTLRHKTGFALIDFGGCMTFGIMSAFMTRYYVNVAMMDTVLIASLTLIWKIFEALANPVIGVFLDKHYADHPDERGKFRPWILRAAPLVAVSAILVFTAPGWVTGASRLVVAFVTYLAYEVFYGIHSIALGGLLSAMARDDTERADLSAARGIGGLMGSVIPQMLFPLILSAFSGNEALGYGVGVSICAAVGFVSCLLSYRFTEERNLPRTSGNTPIRAADILEVLQKNRAFVALCIHGLLQGTLMAVSGSLGSYMYADVLGNLTMMSAASMLTLPVSLVLMSVVPKLTRKMGMQKLLEGSLLAGVAIYLALFGLHVTMAVPVWVHMGMTALAGGMVGLGNMIQWGMLSEAIEYNEYLTGKRMEGSINGTFTMLRRLGQGIGGSVGVALLGLIGYNAAAAAQTAGTILGIKVLCILFPAVCVLGSWICFHFIWNITPEVKAAMAASQR